LCQQVTTKYRFTLVNLGRKKDGLEEALQHTALIS